MSIARIFLHKFVQIVKYTRQQEIAIAIVIRNKNRNSVIKIKLLKNYYYNDNKSLCVK